MDVVQPRSREETKEIAKKNYEAFLAAIPAETIRRENNLVGDLRLLNAKPIVKLARIRNLVESLFVYADGHVACKEGCSYCCHLKIDISRLEAEFIGEKTGVMPVVLKDVAPRDPYAFSEQTPCPFLKKGACSIYEYRPLICRVHVNMDVDNVLCRFENWHNPDGAVPKPTFHSILNAYAELNQKAASAVADIRDYFPLVPDSD